jgi:hypothetical protein
MTSLSSRVLPITGYPTAGWARFFRVGYLELGRGAQNRGGGNEGTDIGTGHGLDNVDGR